MNQTQQLLVQIQQQHEQICLSIANLAEQMNTHTTALLYFEKAVEYQSKSLEGLSGIARIYRANSQLDKAIEWFTKKLTVDQSNGYLWIALGHAYLMSEELQKAYSAYQQALYHLPSIKEPRLWYGIGILYDRFGSLDHAEEAFVAALNMDSNFIKSNEIHFRLGIIYKQQGKYQPSLEQFTKILNHPPKPLTTLDIWFQIGHCCECEKEFHMARESYEHILQYQPKNVKVLQQLAWLYHSQFNELDKAVAILNKAIEIDKEDPHAWYLLGRCYMAKKDFTKAYEAYQYAVYKDSKNPTVWCSIGVLYYTKQQYRDALDSYTKALTINPYIPEVWYDLGQLYEVCNNQLSDAHDAYTRAHDLAPNNAEIKKRFEHIKQAVQNKEPSQLPLGDPLDMNPSQLDHLAKPFNSGSVIARTEHNSPKQESPQPQQQSLTNALNDRFNNIKVPVKPVTEIGNKMQFGESKMQLPSLPNLDTRPQIIHKPLNETTNGHDSPAKRSAEESPQVVKKVKIEHEEIETPQQFEDPKTVQDRNVDEDYDE